MMTAAGYTLIFIYIFFLIFVLGEIVKKFAGVEASRKLVHIMLFGVWVLIDVFLKNTVHQIIIPVIFLILNALSYKFNIYKSVERTEGNHFGTVYFAAAITVVLTIAYFCPAFYYPGGIAIACLTFGDGFAALIGYHVRSPRIHNSKSLAGFLACMIAVILSLLAFRAIYDPALPVYAVFIIGAVTAILEMVDYGLDNFSITFGTFFISYALCSVPGERLVPGIVTALAVFAVVFFAKAIRYYGALLSAVMVFIFAYCGGTLGVVFLLAAYFSIFLISKIKKLCSGRNGRKSEKPRGFLQILINGGLGSLFMVLYGVTGDMDLYIVSLIAISGCFIDSVSSDVGVLSRAKPYDFIRRCHVEKGLSGGVTLLGTSASLAAAALTAVYITWSAGLGGIYILLITAIVFLQTAVDSVLGSVLQVKFICPECGAVTEKKVHCTADTGYYSGVRWIDNNAVNLISSVLVTAAAAVVFAVL
ncbi:MAG: DUF92 domain-containing protein [Clostridia bacterium]|nr:DUF92 domain-containing protein [Clostridia bacterium]